MRSPLFHVWLSTVGMAHAAVPLNDTGQVTCYDTTAAAGTVSASTPTVDPAGFPGQDCVHGFSAADARSPLTKVGFSSTPGRDYTKIANDGRELPRNAALGSGPADWACTRDNLTSLTWEVKVNDPQHLRHLDWTYDYNGRSCGGTLADCTSPNLVNAVNAAGLCGARDWRLPTVQELLGLTDYGRATAPKIDPEAFPNTQYGTGLGTYLASGVTVVSRWRVIDGIAGVGSGAAGSVRLVRSTP